MSKIQGKAKRYDGTAVDYVLLFDWVTGNCIGKSVPDAAGNWTYDHAENLNCGITYVADGCAPITHGSYFFESVADTTINNIGVQGRANFGVGVTDAIPVGMIEMEGTRLPEHPNYGNYQYTDGSVMVWIPMFYYRWGSLESSRSAAYSKNSLDVKSKHDFADLAAANAAGYALHRAFYDNGQIKDGFFVDKYLCSNKAGVASSIKNGDPLSASGQNNPFSGLTGAPSDSFGGAIKAAKTRGSEFFATTIFVQRALSLLSVAHAQAATSADNCAWYDAAGITNFPKGCNNNSRADANDPTVTYTSTGFQGAGKTGSAFNFDRTTHNGQTNGVADLNGNMYEISMGITQLSGTFYALKTTVKAAALTGGESTSTDAWGATGIAANYVTLGASIGALTGANRSICVGNTTQQVFSNALSGAAWQASCAGIPLTTGVSGGGTNLFGNDVIYDNRVDNLCPAVGGYWAEYTGTGVWMTSFYDSYGKGNNTSAGLRSALYV